jgi:transposase
MTWASDKLFQEFEEVPMTMIGGLDVHRQQITFDYVDSDGLVRWGQIRPATRKTLRGWLAEHCPDSDAEFALEGCTGWRYVAEELRAAGFRAHLGDAAEIALLRGPQKRGKTDRADARLLRSLLLEGRFPESWIPPAHVVEMRPLGRLYCTLMDERRAWQQRIHAQLFHQGCPPIRALLSRRVAMRSPVPSCRQRDVSTYTPRCGALMSSAPRLSRWERN